MFKRLKVKLYPTFKQKEMLENHFSGYRFCYNLCLEYKSTLWSDHKKNVSGYDMQKELYALRKEVPWMLACRAQEIVSASLDVEKTYKNFFKHNRGFPRYKSKRGEQSFHAYQYISAKGQRLAFYKRRIKFKTSEHYNNLLETHKIKQCTFKRDLSGDYWATLLIDTKENFVLPDTANEIGIDLGIKDLIITSEGETFENKKHLQSSYYKLRSLQRQHSKTKMGGKNREKLRVKIAKLNRKIRNQKEHYYHAITNQLLRENQTIYVESLAIKNMMKNHRLARNISDASLSLLIRILEYKATWYSREIIKIDKWFPSSKTCSNCGAIKEKLSLSERVYNCACGVSLDRDHNAALNILKEGQRIKALA